MIIIDTGAESKLIQTLKNLAAAEGGYCIRIHAAEGSAEQARRKIITQAREYLPAADLYFFEDGEVYLLAPEASARECKKAMLAIAAELRIQPVEHLGELYELAQQGGALLALLEKKSEHDRQMEEAAAMRKAQEEAAEQLARKRRQILEQGAHLGAKEIAALRSARGEPLVMMIEDDPFSRRLVSNVLQKEYKLAALENADGAVSAYSELAPDLLFLDINLPDVNGHELLEKIVAVDPNAYVVMLSGNADKGNIMQAMSRGAKGFVAKPFSRDKLFQYIERCPTINKEKVQ